MNITVKNSAAEQMDVKITKRIAALKGWPIRKELLQMAEDVIAEYHKVQQGFTPGAVPDLAESTKKAKAREHGFVYPILTATGQMMGQMRAEVRVRSRQEIYSIVIIFDGTRESGITNARLAQIHREGEGNMPKRDFMILSDKFTSRWTRRILAATKGK